ncbi:hypothetical protein [Desulfitobacterium sp.]|uniref:hypothetical protein n=1 Tax=Desulfitobacterium sp. TaxID=49981 RepID=UPI002CE19DD3|nr:hypothetical protein [Desulfitobacterium sp.]HVJ47687.1 hypothetical protein [Desulfitobacterium sp.]
MGRLLLSLFLILSFTFAPISAVNAADSQAGGAQQIELVQDHLVLFPQNGGIGIQEILQLKNAGTEPFKGSSLKDSSGQEKKGWLFPLPKGFSEIQIDGLSSNEFSMVSEGVQIYKSLPPGETQMILFYNLPSSYPVSLTKNISFPTQSFFLVSPDSSPIQSDTLKTEGTFQANGTTYVQMSSKNVQAGKSINFTVVKEASSPVLKGNRLANGYKVTGHPAAHLALFTSEPLVYTNPHIWAIYLILMLGMAVAASILLFRQKQKEKMVANTASNSGVDQEDLLFLKLKHKQDRLLERIKALDEDHQSGKIPTDEYEEGRNNYKKLLVQVKLQLRELTKGKEVNS